MRTTRNHPRHHPHPRIRRQLPDRSQRLQRLRRLPVHRHHLALLGWRSRRLDRPLPHRRLGTRLHPRPSCWRQRLCDPRRQRQLRRRRPHRLVLPRRPRRPLMDGPHPRTVSRQHPHRPRVPDPLARHLQREGRSRRRERNHVRADRRHRRLGTTRSSRSHRREHSRRPAPRLPRVGLHHPDRHTDLRHHRRHRRQRRHLDRQLVASRLRRQQPAHCVHLMRRRNHDPTPRRPPPHLLPQQPTPTSPKATPVAPGQHIADSGDTRPLRHAHLHLELRINGVRHCPQPLLDALYHGTPIPLAADLPTTGCSFQT